MGFLIFVGALVAIGIGVWIINESYTGEGEGCGFIIIVAGIILVIAALCGAFRSATPEEAKQAQVAAQREAAADKKAKAAQAAKDAIAARLTKGEVILVNTAPDGTKLWMAKDQLGNVVYFSTSGTTTDGKPVPARVGEPVAPAPAPTSEPTRTGRPL